MSLSKPDTRYIGYVAYFARIHDQSEFELFHQAYRECVQNEASDEFIEHHFVRFMFEEEIPWWVKRFILQQLSLNNMEFQPQQVASCDLATSIWISIAFVIPTIVLLQQWWSGAVKTAARCLIC